MLVLQSGSIFTGGDQFPTPLQLVMGVQIRFYQRMEAGLIAWSDVSATLVGTLTNGHL